MKLPLYTLLAALAFAQCIADAKPTDNPLVKQALQKFSLSAAPTVDQAKLCVESIEKAQAGPDAEKFTTLLKELYRAESRVSAASSLIYTKLGKLKATHDRAYKQALSYRKDPIRTVQGTVDVPRTNITIENLNRECQRSASEYEIERLKLEPTLKPLTEQLTVTNAALHGYLDSGEREMLIALGTAFFAVKERNAVALGITPPISATWLRLRKLSPGQLVDAMSNARTELATWVEKNLLAKGATELGMHLTISSLESENPLFNVLGGGYLATQGLEVQRQTEFKMQGCLEILLFDPDANAASKKISAAALQQFITGADPKTPLGQRFSDEAIGKFLGKIDSRLATAKSVIDRLSPILRGE
jgi:hypothetical protein